MKAMTCADHSLSKKSDICIICNTSSMRLEWHKTMNNSQWATQDFHAWIAQCVACVCVCVCPFVGRVGGAFFLLMDSIFSETVDEAD